MLQFDPRVRLACQTVVTGKVKLRRLVTDILEDVDLTSLYIKGVEPCSIGVEKYILILFSDIRGFTPFAESLLSYDVIHVLNLYFQKVGEVIDRYGGVLHPGRVGQLEGVAAPAVLFHVLLELPPERASGLAALER